jgi:hypothetical protein
LSFVERLGRVWPVVTTISDARIVCCNFCE